MQLALELILPLNHSWASSSFEVGVSLAHARNDLRGRAVEIGRRDWVQWARQGWIRVLFMFDLGVERRELFGRLWLFFCFSVSTEGVWQGELQVQWKEGCEASYLACLLEL
jgi:hypothetical protein